MKRKVPFNLYKLHSTVFIILLLKAKVERKMDTMTANLKACAELSSCHSEKATRDCEILFQTWPTEIFCKDIMLILILYVNFSSSLYSNISNIFVIDEADSCLSM